MKMEAPRSKHLGVMSAVVAVLCCVLINERSSAFTKLLAGLTNTGSYHQVEIYDDFTDDYDLVPTVYQSRRASSNGQILRNIEPQIVQTMVPGPQIVQTMVPGPQIVQTMVPAPQIVQRMVPVAHHILPPAIQTTVPAPRLVSQAVQATVPAPRLVSQAVQATVPVGSVVVQKPPQSDAATQTDTSAFQGFPFNDPPVPMLNDPSSPYYYIPYTSQGQNHYNPNSDVKEIRSILYRAGARTASTAPNAAAPTAAVPTRPSDVVMLPAKSQMALAVSSLNDAVIECMRSALRLPLITDLLKNNPNRTGYRRDLIDEILRRMRKVAPRRLDFVSHERYQQLQQPQGRFNVIRDVITDVLSEFDGLSDVLPSFYHPEKMKSYVVGFFKIDNSVLDQAAVTAATGGMVLKENFARGTIVRFESQFALTYIEDTIKFTSDAPHIGYIHYKVTSLLGSWNENQFISFNRRDGVWYSSYGTNFGASLDFHTILSTYTINVVVYTPFTELSAAGLRRRHH